MSLSVSPLLKDISKESPYAKPLALKSSIVTARFYIAEINIFAGGVFKGTRSKALHHEAGEQHQH